MNIILGDYFKNLYDKNRMSHAFLLCNTNYDNLKEDLTLVLSDYFFREKINIEDNVDVVLVRPENGKILKESILNLQEVLKVKSQSHLNRVYIIDGVEKMNDYASNSLLKFLEEPEENIYAILISSNINKVLPTIKSRTQVLVIDSSSNFILDSYDENVIDKAVNLINCIERYKTEAIAYLTEFLDKKEDKEIISKIIYIIKYFYRDCLNKLVKKNLCYFEKYNQLVIYVITNNTERDLINKLIIILKAESMLEYNLNVNLFLDKLIIELGMINNE